MEVEYEWEWGDLPSVVLLEVYAYLPVSNRLQASTVCRNWRASAFLIPPYNSLELTLRNVEADGSRVRFLSEHFIHKVPHVSLTFNAANPNCLELVSEILTKLEDNVSLRTLKLRCTEDSLSKEVFYGSSTSALILRKYFSRKVLQPLTRVFRSKNSLETFSFPLIRELSHFQETIQSTLRKTSKIFSLRNLFLTSVQNPHLLKLVQYLGSETTLPSSPLNIGLTNYFVNLQMLSVDHDVLTDDILLKLGIGNQLGGLARLGLIAVNRNEHVSNNGWIVFASNNPNCQVRLTVMGPKAQFDHQSNLIFPSIPITHFRALYCKEIRMPALNSLILWNANSLEHLELVDEDRDWMECVIQSEVFDENQFLDPIIFAAWRCRNLKSIKIGFKYCGQNLIGIARLKGPVLASFEIPRSQVLYHNIQQLSNEISKALSRNWSPIDDAAESRKLRSRAQHTSRKVLSTLRAVVLDEN